MLYVKKKSINLKGLITQSFVQDCIITGRWRSSLLNSSLKVDQTVLGKKRAGREEEVESCRPTDVTDDLIRCS